MKYFYMPAAFLLLISTALFSCKKSAAPLVTFMKLDTNNKVLNYSSCSTVGETTNGQADTYIASQGGSGQFTIILNKPPGSLKTGQVFEAQSTKSLATDNCAAFNYVPVSNSDDVYGYPSSEFQPVGSVTLTEVSSTEIKGTFSAEIFYTSDGTDLLYTITNGSFCTGSSAYTAVININ